MTHSRHCLSVLLGLLLLTTLARGDDFPKLVSQAEQSRCVVLGESHGIVEHGRFLLRLCSELHERGGYNYLALEGCFDRQSYLDRYLEGESPSNELLKATYLAPNVWPVLEWAREQKLKPSGSKLRVVLIDGPSHWNVSKLEQSRDQAMFSRVKTLLDGDPQARVLVYCGNGHTSKNVLLNDKAAGPRGQLDRFEIPSFTLAHYLNLWTEGQTLSVRAVDSYDPIFEKLPRKMRSGDPFLLKLSSSPWAEERGLLKPGGAIHEAVREKQAGELADFLAIFCKLTTRNRFR